MPTPRVEAVSLEEAFGGTATTSFDSLVFVAPSNLASLQEEQVYAPLLTEVKAALAVDESAKSKVSFLISNVAPGKRLVVSPLGRIDRDQDDVRRFGDATRAGVLRAKAAGSTQPLILLPPPSYYKSSYPRAVEVSLLSTLAGLYEPLQARDLKGDAIEVIEKIGFVNHESKEHGDKISNIVQSIEKGRRLARDIGGSDPERMSPLNAAEFLKKAFEGTSVKVSVLTDVEKIKKGYPLLHAVARASLHVPRHFPTVVQLRYDSGSSSSDAETLLFAGKGVTFDTGGADVKAGGIMAGMSRDKIGACSIAGFFGVLDALKPSNLNAVAILGFVRNSVGSDSYVADEIILSHGKKRIQVGNTDAEGRMVLADCLSHLRKIVLKENIKNARIMTCATLTGHAVRAVGPYTISLDNGPAKQAELSEKLKRAGEEWGDCIEVSSIRKEDYDFIAPKNSAYDLLQCNNAASSNTARGHQFPAAFLISASGLDAHGRDSTNPIAFSHIDIAGSACEGIDYQFGIVTATPVVAWTSRYVLPKVQ
eukprot:TRINITY_DN45_c0_g1_i1.p1 TRINITY_DN45_c0_g1~~TRINITY_DN45_c0_g1_i1.p1  ORF type:complete len:561 (+),score=140.56 TRINITY_DN45_c0_g1_i1:76-1683(+)